jgi:hypothetical protein
LDCYADFQTATVCFDEDVASNSPATLQCIKDIFISMHSRDLLLIMRRWEQSGQGEGGTDNLDDDEEQHEER